MSVVGEKEGTPTGDSGVGVGGSSDISPSSAANSIADVAPSPFNDPDGDTIIAPYRPPRDLPPIKVKQNSNVNPSRIICPCFVN